MESQWQDVLHFISPNKNELFIISEYFGIQLPKDKTRIELEEIKNIAEQVAQYVPVVINTLGSEGVLVCILNDTYNGNINREKS